jgi:exoribonuclease II
MSRVTSSPATHDKVFYIYSSYNYFSIECCQPRELSSAICIIEDHLLRELLAVKLLMAVGSEYIQKMHFFFATVHSCV